MKNCKTVRVGTRESRLAIAQTEMVCHRITACHPEMAFEIVPMSTKGDVVLDQALDKIGGKGLFIKELETALLEGRVDLAVHSLKDMPASLPDGLCMAALSAREDPRDVLVTRSREGLAALPPDARMGTSAARRELQLRALGPDFRIGLLRGNVITRLRKLDEGEFDGIILAAAGLKRLGMAELCAHPFSPQQMIPAVGQGVLCVEARQGEDHSWLLDSIHDADAACCVAAERAYMIRLDGGCSTPVAAHATLSAGLLSITGLFASADRSRFCTASLVGPAGDPEGLGIRLAQLIVDRLAGGEVQHG